jgi:hypothetical protein
MALRLRELLVQVRTSEGMFGVRVPFRNKLCVLRAPNTSGKSTCMQAIVYALGLEGMFKSGNDVPLPQAVTDVLKHEDRLLPVLESDVFLEIENHEGDILTVQRGVRSERSRNLVSTWNGAMLTGGAQDAQRSDYYVRLSGAATRPVGFHHMLASFVGWELPEVSRYSGGETPLYMECVAPLFMVEQKKGWAVMPARIPQYFGIRDVAKRAVEFILNLDAYRNALRRHAARERVNGIRGRWKERVDEAKRLAETINGIVENLAPEPTASWPPVISPVVRVSRTGWVSLRDAIRSDWELLSQLETEEIPRVEQVAEQLQDELRALEQDLSRREFAARAVFQELQGETAQKQSAALRVSSLNEDLRRYQDIRTLLRLGSESMADLTQGSCPTCHQLVADSLLPQDRAQVPMSADENIAFIKAQLGIFSMMVLDSDRVITAKEREVASLRADVEELRARIRATRQTLISDGRSPSRAALEERIRLGQQIRQAEKVRASFEELVLRFGELSAEWADVQRDLSSLPAGDLSSIDEEKLQEIERLMKQQLRTYGLSSISPDSISVSRDSYKPIYEGFDLEVNYGSIDLEFNNSASDMIRTHWGYMLALLEVARTQTTNHPGMLVMDEPRQQSTDPRSFAQLLKRASLAGQYGQQVVIATSEERHVLEPMLEGIDHHYVQFSGKLLTPV